MIANVVGGRGGGKGGSLMIFVGVGVAESAALGGSSEKRECRLFLLCCCMISLPPLRIRISRTSSTI